MSALRERGARWREGAWLLAIAACALGARVAFVSAYPTRPFADFRNLVRFAEAYAQDGFARGAAGWELWSLGLPLALSLVLRVVPGTATDIARYATAVVTGLVALAPVLIWRGVYALRTRVIAALLLALWPGHVMVSGVVSQDNWVLLPSVVLAALAVRVLRRPAEPHPMAAAVAWAAAGAIRQEMFVVLVPVALGAAGLLQPLRAWTRRRVAFFGLAALVLTGSVAGLRWMGSGKFSLGTEHPGMAILGACAPGAGASYWTFGQTYFAAFAPEIADDWEQMKQQAGGFVLRELARRPRFHLVRMVAAATNSLRRTDADGLFTSIGSQEAMPAPHYEKGQRLRVAATKPLLLGTAVLMGLGLGALVLAVYYREWPILVVGASIVLKVLVHAVTVAQYRFFIVVTAFALLIVALVADLVLDRRQPWRVVGAAALAGAAGAVLLVRVAVWSEAWVVRHEEQLSYQFVLKDPERAARLRCVVREGILSLLYAPRSAAMRLLQADPRPGESATAECILEARRPTDGLVFEFRDAVAAWGLPGRVVQVVRVDGREAVRHDLAALPGDDWIQVPLGHLDPAMPREIVLEVTAGTAEPGWGALANTAFRLVSAPAAP